MIFDTNALSAFLLADRALLAVVPASVVIRLPVIVLGEYRFGLLKSRERVKLGRLLDECKRRLKSAAGGTEWCGGRKVRHLQINHGGCSLICSNGPRYAAEF